MALCSVGQCFHNFLCEDSAADKREGEAIFVVASEIGHSLIVVLEIRPDYSAVSVDLENPVFSFLIVSLRILETEMVVLNRGCEEKVTSFFISLGGQLHQSCL